jgi:hypothetical protein
MDPWIVYLLLAYILAMQVHTIVTAVHHKRAQKMWRRYLERTHRLERVLQEAQHSASLEAELPLWASVMASDATEYFAEVRSQFQRDREAVERRRKRLSRFSFRRHSRVSKV